MTGEAEMFSVMLLTISAAALGQFGLYYWRSVLAGVAAQAISTDVLEAACVENGSVRGRDFRTLAQLHELTPNLQQDGSSLGLVTAYYRLVDAVGSLASGRIAGLANWAENEGALCARYAAVQIDRRLQSNLALAAAMRSS